MSFHNPTNDGRVAKIIDILKLVQKSGASNGIDREDMWNMLEPAINQIGEMIGEEPAKPENTTQLEPVAESSQKPSQAPQDTRQPLWVDIRQMAEQAPLKDLSIAMAVIMNRFDEVVCKKEPSNVLD